MKSSRAELIISVKDLSRSGISKPSPMVIVERLGDEFSKKEVIGKTEIIMHSENCDFKTPVFNDYVFEQSELLRFSVMEQGKELIGMCDIEFGEILGSPTNSARRGLKDIKDRFLGNASLMVRFSPVKGEDDQLLQIKFSGRNLDKKDLLGKSDPFFEIFHLFKDGKMEKLYKSEVIKSNLNPDWNRASVNIMELCRLDLDAKFLVKVFDWDKAGDADLIGEVKLSVNQLLQNKNLTVPLINAKGKKGGELLSSEAHVFRKADILDYLNAGWKIQLAVAIDFTSSNRDSHDPHSLHHISANLNKYQNALKTVGGIVIPYDCDQRVTAWGFGGIPPNSESVSHCFPLTFNKDSSEVKGLDGLLEAYKSAVQKVHLSGPTLFSHFIESFNRLAGKGESESTYSILLVLTDGEIQDTEKTIDAIIKSSQLPASIIIIGIGEDQNFENMHLLDSDTGKLKHGSQESARDVVQFVRFEKFNGNLTQLSSAVLQEVPKQFIAYTDLKGIKPEHHK